MGERKRITGFGPQKKPEEPPVEKEKETKTDYIRMALEEYLIGYQPFDPDDNSKVDFKTSKDIQNDIRDMVIAPVSVITEYMIEKGYKMVQVEGGKLSWHMQFDMPF